MNKEMKEQKRGLLDVFNLATILQDKNDTQK